ncbi:hypothetical protein J2Y69_002283 [Microbacterium resistens]|uniref:Rho termination factor N-terminal domain-containing protein n=1 Tax=Microbacterium resistens TaxID=156977 RepID=A0ABU1SDN5_9MICO|nr:hypothetical protein [Microbacterium resistens]MDR6867679.1 hypothetical protein [Microbacterium resistens]
MIRILHPRPQAGHQHAFDVDFLDGTATVDDLHPERERALVQHGYEITEYIVGTMLEDLTVAELRDIADVEGVDLPPKAKKAQIITAIEASPAIPVLE